MTVPRDDPETYVIALVKGSERYVWIFDEAHAAEALRSVGRLASNPELSFTWYDAAVLSQRIRQRDQLHELGEPPAGAEPWPQDEPTGDPPPPPPPPSTGSASSPWTIPRTRGKFGGSSGWPR